VHSPDIVQSFFLIFTGAAILATVSLYTRQPLIVAYIALGILFGPHAFGLVTDAALLGDIAEIGIIFLLFLVGLDLQPSKLRNMVGETLLTGLATTAIFFAVGFAIMRAFDFTTAEAVITGIAVTFSSTILGIKLLPTTVLHHRHIGEIVVSLLLIQDLLAIIALLFVGGYADSGSLSSGAAGMIDILIALPLLAGGAYLGVRFVILPLIAKFDAFHEFIFLLAIGWCLGLASVADTAGLSLEIGAFVAGVTLATSPIAQYIAESLRPLRDFFLVLFFFSVGAAIDPELLTQVIGPTVLLAAILIAVKPAAFAVLLRWQGEATSSSWEVGFRLGQASEFSLLLSYVAGSAALLGAEAAHVIQGATVLTLLASSYLGVFRYPSPIAMNPKLRRN
jgi:Kef-type K+ transport system membrane component KefB